MIDTVQAFDQSKLSTKREPLTIASYLLSKLALLKVKQIFCPSNKKENNLQKHSPQTQIQFIDVTRENAAGAMADAHSRMHGLGVVYMTYGVGVNLANAISQAYIESSPLLIISEALGTDEYIRPSIPYYLANKPLSLKLGTTEFDIFRHITIDQESIANPEQAAHQIDRAIENCLLYKKPVYIEIPRNIIAASIPHHNYHPYPPVEGNKEILLEAVREISFLLERSQKPFLLVGHEIHRYSLQKPLLKLAETHNLPIVSSILGKSAIDEHHPLYIGVYRGKESQSKVREFVLTRDCALSLGETSSHADKNLFPPQLCKKHIVIASSEGVQINHHQYGNILFSDLIESLSTLDLKSKRTQEPPKTPAQKKLAPFGDTPLSSERAFAAIKKLLPPQSILVSEVGESLLGAVDLTVEKSAFVSSSGFAPAGFAIPAAIAIQLYHPEKRVVCILEHRDFQMTCMELITAARYGADPLFVILTDSKNTENSTSCLTKLPEIIGKGRATGVHKETAFATALEQAFSRRGEYELIEACLSQKTA